MYTCAIIIIITLFCSATSITGYASYSNTTPDTTPKETMQTPQYSNLNEIQCNTTTSNNIEDKQEHFAQAQPQIASIIKEILLSAFSLVRGDFLSIGSKLIYDNGTPLPDQELVFYADNTVIGSNHTDRYGWAKINWNTSTAEPKNYTINITYAGNPLLNITPCFYDSLSIEILEPKHENTSSSENESDYEADPGRNANQTEIQNETTNNAFNETASKCVNVTCPEKCSNSTEYTNGICDNLTGKCTYDVIENSTNCGYMPENKTGETTNKSNETLETNTTEMIPTQVWDASPQEFIVSAYRNSSGNIGVIEISNYANNTITFSYILSGNASQFLLLSSPPAFSLIPNTQKQIYINYTVLGGTEKGIYESTITLKSQKPQKYINITIYLVILEKTDKTESTGYIEEQTTQLPAEVNQPVTWVRKISIINTTLDELANLNITVNLPKESSNIVDEYGEIDKNDIETSTEDTKNEANPHGQGTGISSASSKTSQNKIVLISSGKLLKKYRSQHLQQSGRKIKGMQPAARTAEFIEIEYQVNYTTPAPVKTEKEPVIKNKKISKKITIESDASIHYTNVIASTNLIESTNTHTQIKNYRLIWLNEGKRIDVTNDPAFNVRFSDTNNNGIYDQITWTIPQMSEQNFELLADFMNLAVWPDKYTRNWTVYFSITGEDDLLIEKFSNSIEYDKLYYYDNSWKQAYPSSNETAAWMFWNGTQYSRGKIVYNILDMDNYLLKFTFGEITQYTENYNYYTQKSNILNLDDCIFKYASCSYNDTHWMCNPQKYENGPGTSDDRYDPGYWGEIYTTDSSTKQIKYFGIPNKSSVTNFSVQLVNIDIEPVETYPYPDNYSSDGKDRKNIALGSIFDDIGTEVIISSDYDVQVWNSTKDIKWTYSTSEIINDIASGDISIGDPNDEIVVATENSLVLLAANKTELWKIDGKNYESAAVGDISSEHTLHSQSDYFAENLTCIGCSDGNYSINFALPYNFESLTDKACYVKTALNYRGSKTKNLTFTLNGTVYDLDESRIAKDNEIDYHEDDSIADGTECIGCANGNYTQNFTLWYDIDNPIPALSCYIKTALNYKGSKNGNLTFTLNNNVYDLDENEITENAEVTYKLDDNSTEALDYLITVGDYSGIFLSYIPPDGVKARSCYVKAAMCYNGSKADNLKITLNTKDYSIDTNQITKSCDTGEFGWTETEVNCSDLIYNDHITYSCVDCNSTAKYGIFADNSTSGNSYNQTDALDYDYMIRIYTNSSLLYDWTYTEVNCSDFSVNSNITYQCPDCNDTDNYNIMTDSKNNGHSYFFDGNSWNTTENNYDHIVRIYTNESLLGSWVSTKVDCADIAQGSNITYICKDCNDTEYYNALADSSTSGNSYISHDGGISWDPTTEDVMAVILTKSVQYTWINTQVNCSDILQDNQVKFECYDCNDTDNYNILTDSKNKGHSQFFNGHSWDATENDYDHMVRIYSNKSLLSSWVSTKVDCADVAQNKNITYTCEDCNDTNHYNALADSSTSGNSYATYDNGNSWSGMPYNYMVNVEIFGSNPGEEVAAADSDNTLHVLNSTAGLLWNYSATSRAYDIKIKDIYCLNEGNEIIIGTGTKLIVLNSSGGLIWQYPGAGNVWVRKISVEELNGSSTGPEIAIGTNDGRVITLSSTGTLLWNYSVGNSVRTIDIKDITFEEGNEVVAGLSNGRIIAFNNLGNLVLNYTKGTGMFDSATGDIKSEIGNEIAFVSKNDFVYVMNFNNTPINISIDIGNDGTPEWEATGALRSTQDISDINTAFNDYIQNNCSASSLCDIPVAFGSSTAGKYRVRLPRVSHTYDANGDMEYNDPTTAWAKLDNVHINESILYEALNITYTNTPQIPIYIRYIMFSGIPIIPEYQFNENTCGRFGSSVDLGYTCKNGSSEGCDRDYYFSDFTAINSYDLLWHNNSANAIPTVMNNSSPYAQGSINTYNITIYRNSEKTADNFTNIIANMTINDSLIKKDASLKVEWYSNGTYYDITPEENQIDCNTSNPTYTTKNIDSYIFKVCRQDTDNNGRIDYFGWIQPILGPKNNGFSVTNYQITGYSNTLPNITNANVSNASDYWGETFNFTAKVLDVDGDNVTVTLWTKAPDSDWTLQSTKNITNGSTASFIVNSGKSWTGLSNYRFEYFDINSSGYPIHEAQNTTEFAGPVANKHNISIIHIKGNNTIIQQDDSTSKQIIIRLNDTITGSFVNESDIICKLWIEENETYYLNSITPPNSTGYCSYNIYKYPPYPAGDYKWKVSLPESSFFLSNNSDEYTITIKGSLNATVDLNPTPQGPLYRNDGHISNTTIEWNMSNVKDKAGLDIQGNVTYNITWKGQTIEYGEFGANTTCNGTYNIPYNETLSLHTFQIKLNKTNYADFVHPKNYNVYGQMNVTVISPGNETLIYKGQTVVLRINVTNDLNQSVSGATVAFDIESDPSDTCVYGIKDEGNGVYNCTYSPSETLAPGSYIWHAEVTKQNYEKADSQNRTIKIGGNITATIDLNPTPEGPVYRYNNSYENTTIFWNITNIASLSGQPIDNVNYTILWNEEIITGGITSSDGVNGSFDIPDNDTGLATVKIILNKTDYNPYIHTADYNVHGELNITIMTPEENAVVYRSGTNSTLLLRVNVTDDFNNTISNANIVFDIESDSADTCLYGVQDEGNGIYNCTYKPQTSLIPSRYFWNASASKQYYSTAVATNRNITLKGRMHLEFLNNSQQNYRNNLQVLYARLKDEQGSILPKENVSCNLSINNSNIDNSPTDTNGICTMQWDTTCLGGSQYYPNRYNVSIELNTSLEFYDIEFSETNGTFDLVDNVTMEIITPEDGTLNLSRGESTDLLSHVSDSCGVPHENIRENIIWKEKRDGQFSGTELKGINHTYYTVPDAPISIVTLLLTSDYSYYKNVFEDESNIILETTTKIVIISDSDHYRNASVLTGQEFELKARIMTGSNEIASDMDPGEDWSNYNCTWFIDSTEGGTTQTDLNGTCSYAWNTTCSNNPGSHNITVAFTNTTPMKYPIWSNGYSDTQFDNIYDNATISILSPSQDDKYYYLDATTLSSNVVDTCGTPSINYTVQWTYEDAETNKVISDKDGEWIATSSAYGYANISVSITYPYYISKENKTNISFWRKANLASLDSIKYPPKNNITNVTCTVSINGLENKSRYNISFFVDGKNETIAQTNYTASAVFEFNSAGYAEGYHTFKCNITNDTSRFITVGEVSSLEKEVIIPTDLIVSDLFVDNLAKYNPGTGWVHYNINPSGNDDGNDDVKVVYRSQTTHWCEPQILYMGTNVSVASPTGLRHFDNVTVHFYIEGNGISRTEVTNCTTNISLYDERWSGNFDDIYEEYYGYVCTSDWDVSGLDYPVGEYNITANATFLSSEWTSNQKNESFKLFGILTLTINSSLDHMDVWSDENLTLTANVTDDLGNTLTDTDAAVNWYYDGYYNDHSCWGGSYIGTGSGENFETEWSIWVYNIYRQECISRNIYVTAKAYAPYYEVEDIDTKCDTTGDCYNRDDSYTTWWQKTDPDIYHKTKVELTDPDQDTAEVNETTFLLNFTCTVSRVKDNMNLKEGYPVDFTCQNCLDSQNKNLNTTTDLNGDAVFTLNFTDETLGNYYNFTCSIEDNEPYYRTISPYNNDTKEIKIVYQLGEGDGGGDCNHECYSDEWQDTRNNCPFIKTWEEDGNNIPCDENETYATCPSDCHYINGTSNTTNSYYNESYVIGGALVAGTPNIATVFATSGLGEGCNYDGTWQAQFEGSNCIDFPTQSQQPPLIQDERIVLNIAATLAAEIEDNYVKSGTIVYIEAKITDPNGDLTSKWIENSSNPGVSMGSMQNHNYLTDYYIFEINASSTETYYIHAKDSANNEVNATVDLTVDDTPPVITSVEINGTDIGGTKVFGNNKPILVNVTLQGTENTSTIEYVKADGNTLTYQGSNLWSGITYADSSKKYVNVTVVDRAEWYAENSSVTYETDDNPPSVNITHPPDGTLICGESYVFNVTINDTEGYGDPATYRYSLAISGTDYKPFDGNTSLTDYYVFVNATSHSPDGAYIFRVRALDTLGNTNNTETITVHIDNTPPAISFVTPGDGSVLNGQIYFNATIIDSHPGTSTYKYRIDEGAWQAFDGNVGNTYYVLIDTGSQSEQEHNFTVKANDTCSNQNFNNLHYTVDKTNPSVIINTPAPNENVSGTIRLNATIIDTNPETSTYKYKIDSGSWYSLSPQPATSNWYVDIDTSTLANNTNHIFYVQANDSAGNSNTTDVTVFVDNAPPIITIDAPDEGEIVSGVFWLNVTVKDSGAGVGVKIYSVNWSNSTVWYPFEIINPPVYNRSINASEYSEGDLVLLVRANDTEDNYAQKSVTVIIDKYAPFISITSPQNNAHIRATRKFDIIINDSGDHGNTSTYMWKIENISWGGSYDSGWSSISDNTTLTDWYVNLDTQAYSNGNYIFWAKASDTLNQQNITSTNITIDNTPPAVTINKPQLNEDIYSIYTINATIIDPDGNGKESTYKYKITKGATIVDWTQLNSAGNNHYTHNFDTTPHADSEGYLLNVTAQDIAGNTNSTTITFTIDNNPPKVIIQTPPQNSNLTGYHYFNVTITDDANNGNTATYKYKFDTSGWSDYDGNISDVWYINYDITTLSDGTHIFYVNANDTLGRSNNTENISFIADNTKPLVKIISPQNGSVVNKNIDIIIEINDSVTGINIYNVTFDGSLTSPFSCSGNLNNKSCNKVYATGSDGDKVIKLTALDFAGNLNTTNITVTVDNTNPSVNIVNPQNNANLRKNATFNITINDTHPDYSTYKYNLSNSTWNSGWLQLQNTSLTDWFITINTSLYKDGTYKFEVIANDTLDNSNNTESITVKFDNTNPLIDFVPPTEPNNTYISKSHTCINVTVTDTYSTSSFIDWNRSLVGYWSFEHVLSNGTVYDSSTYKNDGIMINFSSNNTVSGKYGSALEFDGMNDYVNLGTDLPDFGGTNQFTFSAWIYLSSGSSGGQVISRYDGGVEGEFYLSINDTGYVCYLREVPPYGMTSNNPINYDAWSHVIVVYNGSDSSIYIDSNLDRTTSHGSAASAPSTDVLIGARYDSGSPTEYFNGTIDEVRIWNRALSPEEINASYNTGLYRLYHNFTGLEDGAYTYSAHTIDLAGNSNSTETRTITIDTIKPLIDFVPPTEPDNKYIHKNHTYINVTVTDTYSTSSFIDWNRSLVGYWSFDSYNTTGIHDNSTYTNFGTFNGGLSTSDITAGKYGKALDFDGDNAFVDCGNDASLNITNEITIEAWVKADTITAWDCIVMKESDNWDGYGIYFDDSIGWLAFYVGGYATNTAWVTISTGSWHHIVGTYDKNAGSDQVKLYKDGIEGGYPDTYTGSISTNTEPLVIGADSDGNYPFNGAIDEVRIYNRALSPEEINASYNTGLYKLYRNFTGLEDGAYTYTAHAIDLAGNTNSTETRTITIDNNPPKVIIQTGYPIYPTSDINQTWAKIGDTLKLKVNIKDSPAGTKNNVTINGTKIGAGYIPLPLAEGNSIDGNYTNNSVIVGSSLNGIHYLAVFAYDNAGNLNNTETLEVRIDNSNPAVSINLPQQQENASGLLKVNATVIDIGSADIARVDYNLSDSSWSTLVEMTNQANYWYNNSYNTASISDGHYNVTIVARDWANNINSTELAKITIDNTKAIISIDSPEQGQIVKENITINATINDTLTGIINYNATIGGILVSTFTCSGNLNNKTCTGTFDTTEQGWNEVNKTITVTAKDYAQNKVALVVLAELAGGVALAFEDRGHRAVGLLPALRRARQADLGHARANGHRATDEGGATRRAALLRVIVGEGHAFPRHPVDVRRLVAHHATVVVADVPGTDVVAPDNQDVRLLRLLRLSLTGRRSHDRPDRQHSSNDGPGACPFEILIPLRHSPLLSHVFLDVLQNNPRTAVLSHHLLIESRAFWAALVCSQ